MCNEGQKNYINLRVVCVCVGREGIREVLLEEVRLHWVFANEQKVTRQLEEVECKQKQQYV